MSTCSMYSHIPNVYTITYGLNMITCFTYVFFIGSYTSYTS